MNNFTKNYYEKLYFGFFEIKNNLKYLTPNEQAYILAKYGKNMRYEDVMKKFDLDLIQLNIVRHSAELKMSLLIAKDLLPYQLKEVQRIKGITYPELAETEYDNYVWDVNEDLTNSYFTGKFAVDNKSNKETNDIKVEENTEVKPIVSYKHFDGRKKKTKVSEDEKQKIINHLKYFSPIQQLCLIHAYKLFGEDSLTAIGIAAKYNCGLKNIAYHKTRAYKVVNTYILQNTNESKEFFDELEKGGKVFESLTKDNYLTFEPYNVGKGKDGLQNTSLNEDKVITKPIDRISEEQKIIDKLKYFSTVKQLALIAYYKLFGEDGFNFSDIAKRIGCDPAFVSKHKKSAIKLVEEYILTDNPVSTEYFNYLDEIKATYTPLTKDTYLNITKDDLEFERHGKKKEFKPKSNNEEEVKSVPKIEQADQIREEKKEIVPEVVVKKANEESAKEVEETEENHQNILDILKYFTKAEQACLVYGYGLFGVKKGTKGLAKHFGKGYDIKQLINRTILKKRLLTKPLSKMTEAEFFKYQQIIDTVYEVNDESFYCAKQNKSTAQVNEIYDLISKDISMLAHLPQKIQYILLATYGYYGKKISLNEIAKNLGYTQPKISVYKSYGNMCVKLLYANRESLSAEEIKKLDELLRETHGILSKEDFEKFPDNFSINKESEQINELDASKYNRGKRFEMPEFFKPEFLKYFPVREQVVFYLLYGIDGVKNYSLSKIAEAVASTPQTLKLYINECLAKMKIITSSYEELSDEEKKIYNSTKKIEYLEITKDNVFNFIKNKNSLIYYTEKGATL